MLGQCGPLYSIYIYIYTPGTANFMAVWYDAFFDHAEPGRATGPQSRAKSFARWGGKAYFHYKRLNALKDLVPFGERNLVSKDVWRAGPSNILVNKCDVMQFNVMSVVM